MINNSKTVQVFLDSQSRRVQTNVTKLIKLQVFVQVRSSRGVNECRTANDGDAATRHAPGYSQS